MRTNFILPPDPSHSPYRKGVKNMNEEKLDRLSDVLLDFVERAAKKATSETEVKALPEVAAVLVEIFKIQ